MRHVIISIDSLHAERIYAGEKRAELRKSFASDVNIVYLYEKAPKSSITGFFITENPRRIPVDEIRCVAENYGVQRDRVSMYFHGRDAGWIIPVSYCMEFDIPISLGELKLLDHYFSVPQSFQYISDGAPIFELIKRRVRLCLSDRLHMKKLASSVVKKISGEIVKKISENYSDIQDDFFSPVYSKKTSEKISLTTTDKTGYGFYLGNIMVGYTFFSEKVGGCVKSGPTAINEEFSGFGLGSQARNLMVQKATACGYRRIYCTTPSTNSKMIFNLIGSGYSLCAVHKNHLNPERDEISFYKDLIVNKNKKNIKKLSKTYIYKKIQNDEIDNFFGEIKRGFFCLNYSEESKIFKNNLSKMISSGSLDVVCASRSSNSDIMFFLIYKKRSDMLKIILSSECVDVPLLKNGIIWIESEYGPRKIIVHAPLHRPQFIEALLGLEYSCEGVCNNQYGNDFSFVFLGKVFT